MKKSIKILIAIIAILLVIQLPVFTPAKNFTEADPVNDIAKKYDVPMDTYMLIYKSCYDCHSNYTQKYPWYYQLQPVSWWMARHIHNGKKELNFSEFATYSPKKAAKKFDEIREQMEEKKMPIKSYLLMHDDARLSEEEYKQIADWAQSMHLKLVTKTDSVQHN